LDHRAEKFFARRTAFNEFLPVHEYTIIIVQRPEAAVELPVGVLRQGHSVAWIIVPGVMELVNMGRIHDTFHFTGCHPVTRKRTGVFVGKNDHLNTKAGITACLNTDFVKFFVFPDFGCGRSYLEHAA
jgi:hypothetical protein